MNKSSHFVGQHIFSQIHSLSSKNALSGVFQSSKANRYYKKIKCWDHYVSMMFCVLAHCTSLREITMGLEAFEGKLNHLNIEKAPPRSTLADANMNRSSEVFRMIYNHLKEHYKPSLSDSTLPKAVLNNLFLIDSTVFGLFKAILKTSGRNRLDGKRKGGIKKNTVLEASTLMPVLINFNAAADSDHLFLKYIELPSGSYLAFDKGYNNYSEFAAYTEKGIFFITRQKDNAVYRSVEELEPDSNTPDAVLKDETIEQVYTDKKGKKQILRLRRIAYWVEKEKRVYEFITNNFQLSSQVIADIYKFRWQIELFFKKLKQNFPLQYFVGDNQNAIEIQIWCSLIALLLLTVIHSQNKSKMAFSNLATLIRIHLAGYISIKDLIALHNKKRQRKSPPPFTHPDIFNSG